MKNLQKKELRVKMKQMRSNCENKDYLDNLIFENFFSQSVVKNAQSFFIYNSFGSEADTKKIITQLLKEEKEVYLPIVKGEKMNLIKFIGQAFKKGNFGIEEPIGEPIEVVPEICVLPLLAIDLNFNRLGYGGGFYDKFLQNKNIFKIGLAYSFQIVDSVPNEEYDISLDAICSDGQVLYRR